MSGYSIHSFWGTIHPFSFHSGYLCHSTCHHYTTACLEAVSTILIPLFYWWWYIPFHCPPFHSLHTFHSNYRYISWFDYDDTVLFHYHWYIILMPDADYLPILQSLIPLPIHRLTYHSDYSILKWYLNVSIIIFNVSRIINK